MATDVTKVRGDQYDFYLDGVLVPGVLSASWPVLKPNLKAISGADTPNALGQMVNGYTGAVTVRLQQRERATLKMFMPWLHATDNTGLPAAGTVLETVEFRAHNKNDGESLVNDIIFDALAFTYADGDNDGRDEAICVLEGMICEVNGGIGAVGAVVAE